MTKHIYLNFWAKVPEQLSVYRVAVTVLSLVSPLVVSGVICQSSAQTPNAQRIDQSIETLSSDNLLERLNIATALGKLNEREFSQEALEKLKQALESPDWRVRSSAAIVFAQKGGVVVKDALPALVKNLRDENWFVRSSAARAIGNIVAEDTGDPSGSNTVVESAKFSGYLVDALQEDTDFSVRLGVATALIKLNTKSSFTVSRLIANLSNTNDPQTRLDTIENLKIISNEVNPIVPNIAKALKHSEPSVRGLAVETIGSIGADASVVMPYFIQSLQDPDAIVRSKAARTIVRVVTNLQDKARGNYITSSDLDTIDDLETARKILQDPQNNFYNNEKESVGLAINALQAVRRNR